MHRAGVVVRSDARSLLLYQVTSPRPVDLQTEACLQEYGTKASTEVSKRDPEDRLVNEPGTSIVTAPTNVTQEVPRYRYGTTNLAVLYSRQWPSA